MYGTNFLVSRPLPEATIYSGHAVRGAVSSGEAEKGGGGCFTATFGVIGSVLREQKPEPHLPTGRKGASLMPNGRTFEKRGEGCQ